MRRMGRTLCLAGWLVALTPWMASAHCDALDGPVVSAARQALERRDVTAVLPWVQPSSEAEVRDAFDRTLQVRALGGDAQALAERWFFETLVRIHRAGEGAPFDGLKPAGQVDPILTAADRALESGSVDALAEQVAGRAVAGMRERFAHARDLKTDAGASVDAGRRYVAAYVEFLHYVEGIDEAARPRTGAHESHVPAATDHAH